MDGTTGGAGPGWRKVTRDEFFEGCIGYPLLPFSLLPDHPAVSSYDYPPNQMLTLCQNKPFPPQVAFLSSAIAGAWPTHKPKLRPEQTLLAGELGSQPVKTAPISSLITTQAPRIKGQTWV